MYKYHGRFRSREMEENLKEIENFGEKVKGGEKGKGFL